MLILSFDVGIINLAYCIFNSQTCKIVEWEVITLQESSNYSKLYINLIKALDSRPFLLNVDTVIIEKQPSFNPKMRIIGGCLQTYFFIRGVVDRTESPINSVDFFSPKHKLKCYSGPELKVTGKSKYSQTKKMGVLIARSKLDEYSDSENFKSIFEQSKKKDDLADCYLQAITYSLFKKVLGQSTNEPTQEIDIYKSKASIKKKLKEYLDTKINPEKVSVLELMDPNFKTGIHTVFNDSPESIKKSISIKWNISFPVNIEKVNEILLEMSMKSYTFKKYF
jgi:hypothetical protein